MEQTFLDIRLLVETVEEIRSEVSRLRRGVRHLEEKCTARTSHYGIRGGGEGNGREELMVQLCDRRTELARKEQELAELEKQMEEWINRVPRPRWRMVLRCRYLDGMDLTDVAEELSQATGHSFSMSQIYRLHRQALESADRLRRDS